MTVAIDSDAELIEKVRRKVGKAFSLPDEPPGPEPTERLEEWERHLLDLGYLPEVPANPGPALVRAAIEAFVRDAERTFGEAAVRGPGEPGDPPEENPVTLRLATDLLSFDREAPLRGRPPPGRPSLESRVLHFRLKTLGLYTGEVSAPTGAETRQALARLGALTGRPAGEAPPLESLADLPELMRDFREGMPDRLVVMYSPFDAGEVEADYSRLGVSGSGRLTSKRKELELLRETKPRAWERNERDWRHRRDDDPATTMTGEHNRFALALIQVRLWTLGYYRGRLDWSFGRESFRALLQGIGVERIEREEILVHVGGGFWALHFPRAMREILATEPLPVAAGIGDDHLAAEAAPTAEVAAESPGLLERIWDEARSLVRKALALGRRVYHGIGALLRSALDGLVRGVRMITDLLRDAVGPVFSFFKSVYRGVREGLALLRRSIRPFVHFVVGKPVSMTDGRTGAIASARFAMDRDCAVLVSGNAKPDLVRSHAALCRRLARTLAVVIRFVARVLHLVILLAAGPISWIRVGIRLAFHLRDALRPGGFRIGTAPA